MIEGVLLKGYGGFYYVYAEDRVWECSLRGRFRVKDQDFLPGDRVRILPDEEDKATIEAVEPRRNALSRPTIANVDQALLVFAMTSPKPDLNLLDRLLIQVTDAEIEPILVFTKLDKFFEAAVTENSKEPSITDVYRKTGYTVFEVSSETGQGIEEVGARLKEKISVLAGPSGAGKSSLFNALSPGKKLKTGELSLKSKRGRHTTRHVELMVCAGGLVADTPGFSSLFLPNLKREELAECFPEFVQRRRQCRFSSCIHDKEPNCAIKEAVESGEISPFRYEHYLIFLQEVIDAERRY
ncbi:MAG TPA: ribosome small subunit-dependent GTPase A [Desulfosporosinus sp.]|nr:ribosome small subunit-dependent GTPase A [Desulfosporosinus sp.]